MPLRSNISFCSFFLAFFIREDLLTILCTCKSEHSHIYNDSQKQYITLFSFFFFLLFHARRPFNNPLYLPVGAYIHLQCLSEAVYHSVLFFLFFDIRKFFNNPLYLHCAVHLFRADSTHYDLVICIRWTRKTTTFGSDIMHHILVLIFLGAWHIPMGGVNTDILRMKSVRAPSHQVASVFQVPA